MSVDSSYLSNFVNRGTKLACLLLDPLDETKFTKAKQINNLKLNYLQDLDALKRQIELSIRPSKDDPVLIVNKIEIHHNREYCELTSEFLKELISTKIFQFNSKTEQFQLKVAYFLSNYFGTMFYNLKCHLFFKTSGVRFC